MSHKNYTQLSGAGLGFRRELLEQLKSAEESTLKKIHFLELAPENWMHCGGRYARDLREFTERFPFTAHGLSLSIGASSELDLDFLSQLKLFLNEHQIALYTEHLSWCSDKGHLYDLLPMPCTEEAVHWVANRVRRVQDILERKIALENVSYYFSPPGSDMSEAEFISAILREADCLLHLDVNNIYVNSKNFGYDPEYYLRSLPLERVCYVHVAGHYVEADGLIIDTHGADVIDPVWHLLDQAYQNLERPADQVPTCLERDFNFPSLADLVSELDVITEMQARHTLQTRSKVG